MFMPKSPCTVKPDSGMYSKALALLAHMMAARARAKIFFIILIYRKDIKTNVAAKISFILNITCKIKDFLRITRSTKVHYGKILLQREQYFHRDILTRGEHI